MASNLPLLIGGDFIESISSSRKSKSDDELLSPLKRTPGRTSCEVSRFTCQSRALISGRANWEENGRCSRKSRLSSSI